jgi:CheY-like chemotaxis protein
MHSVLVVEDDDTIRETLVEFLGDHGFLASGASHGREALDKLSATEPPCLIVLDLMMPVMDGREFRAQMLADPELSKVPVIVISALREGSLADLQVTSFLKKPLKLADLLTLVKRHCPEEV